MVLLKNVCDAATGIMLTDHLWLTTGGWAEHLGPGNPVTFTVQMPACRPKTGGTKSTKGTEAIATNTGRDTCASICTPTCDDGEQHRKPRGSCILTVVVDCYRVNGGLLRSTTQATNRRVQSARAR
jgi:hypothetical protein